MTFVLEAMALGFLVSLFTWKMCVIPSPLEEANKAFEEKGK